MKSPCLFDESLERLVGILVEEFGTDTVKNGVVLRDVSGQLTFFFREPVDDGKIADVSKRLLQMLDTYARIDRVIADCRAAGAAFVLDDTTQRNIIVSFPL